MKLTARSVLFVASQIAFLIAATVTATHGLSDSARRRVVPTFHREPLLIRPLYDDPRVAGDAQLLMVLQRLMPPSTTDFPKVNHVDHALRFWGVESEFGRQDVMDGQEMREFLVNDRYFRELAGQQAGRLEPLLLVNRTGIGFRTQEGRDTSSHTDHTLATLAEVGTPLDYPLQTPAGRRPLATALTHALRHFSLDQPEYEWSAVTFALYGVKDQDWYSSGGRKLTWDRVAQRLMRQPMGQGCCYGGHRLYTLTILLRIDANRQLLSPKMRERVLDHLADATTRLVANQNAEGAMDGAWPGAPILKDDKLSPLGQQLLATGHALEWWAMAPEEVQPPRESVVRAGQWMCRRILAMSDQVIHENYTFLTHAGRALVLWRSVFPAEFQATHEPQVENE